MKTTKNIGPIEIFESQVLGVGSSGSVFKGKIKKPINLQNRNIVHKEEIAVKVVSHQQRYENQVTEYLFDSEKNALMKLSHPNVIKCFGVYEDEKNSYLATELIKGGTLKEYIKQKGLISEKDAVHLLKQLLHAVNYINSQGFIHRDLKPANIMIKQIVDTNTNERILEPVIIDFGYAEMLHSKWKPQMFYNVGSPSYMAPEAYKQTSYTEKTDLWALGVVFFEILTGNTFDTDVKIEELFKRPKYYIEKKLSQKNHCLSARCMKILKTILVVNEIQRPDTESTFRFVSRIQQTYKISQMYRKQVFVPQKLQKNQQPVMKNPFDNLIVNLQVPQQRLRAQTHLQSPLNIQQSTKNESKILTKNYQFPNVVVPRKQVKMMNKILSDSEINIGPLIEKLNQSFVQQASKFTGKFDEISTQRRAVHSSTVSNLGHSDVAVRNSYQNLNKVFVNPQMRKTQMVTFRYTSPLHNNSLVMQRQKIFRR